MEMVNRIEKVEQVESESWQNEEEFSTLLMNRLMENMESLGGDGVQDTVLENPYSDLNEVDQLILEMPAFDKVSNNEDEQFLETFPTKTYIPVQPVNIAGYLVDASKDLIEGIIGNDGGLKSLIEFSRYYDLSPDEAWTFKHVIDQRLKHIVYHKNIVIGGAPSAIDLVNREKDHMRAILNCHIEEKRENNKFKNLLFDSNTQLRRIWSKQIRLGDNPEGYAWDKPPLNCSFEKVVKNTEEAKKDWKDLANYLDPNSEFPTDLDQVITETGVICINWPWTWGTDQEIKGYIARAFHGINKVMCEKTGLQGPLLGLNGRICFHIGIETDEFGGRMRYHSYHQNRNLFDMELVSDIISPEQFLTIVFHEWFHALDFFLGNKYNHRSQNWFLSRMQEYDINSELELPRKKLLEVVKQLLPKGPLPDSKVICDSLSYAVNHINQQKTFGFDSKFDIHTELLKIFETPQSQETGYNVLSKFLHILEIDKAKQGNELNEFSYYCNWMTVKMYEIEARIRHRGRPTSRHPMTILARLSTRFKQSNRKYDYFDNQELVARSFEMMIADRTGQGTQDFWPLMSPSFPSNDFHLVREKWLEFFESLTPWWQGLEDYTLRIKQHGFLS